MNSEVAAKSILSLPMNETVSVYTDGACINNPGPAAWAIIVVSASALIITASASLGLGTNNIAEMTAALEALALFQARPDLLVTVFSDSKLVIKGMTEWMPGWKRRGWRKSDGKLVANMDLWVQLDALASPLPFLKWQWVRGHNGNEFNEMADDLASAAAQQ